MPERLPERRRRRRPDLRKLMIVLPSLFTVSSIFCGVYSIMLSSGETTGDNFYRAAVAIFYGYFFDALDGRVARMTKTQSNFGVELDSLADVITFGVAPAILVYKWALYGLGFGGIVIAAIYAACGAIRLARFNVLAHSEAGVHRFFVGLPIPLAAGMLVSLVIAVQQPRAPAESVAVWPSRCSCWCWRSCLSRRSGTGPSRRQAPTRGPWSSSPWSAGSAWRRPTSG